MSGRAHHKHPHLVLHPATWREDAACYGSDTEALYPAGGRGAKAHPMAVGICRSCPVRVDCLTDALVVEDPGSRHGVWGGLTANQRKQAWERLTVDERAVYRPQLVADEQVVL